MIDYMYVRFSSIFLLISLFIISSANAQTIENYSIQKLDVIFDINPDDSVNQNLEFTFSNPVTVSSINYSLDGPVRNVQILGDNQKLDYSITNLNNSYNLQIFLKGSTNKLDIIYTSDKVIFHSDSVLHFFTEFSFVKTIPTMNVKVNLPIGYGIYQGNYRPGNANIVSDGQRIILTWSVTGVNDSVFSVKFVKLDNGINLWFIVALFAIVSGIVLYFHFKNKAKEEFLSGFREDEKKVIEYLEKHKKVLQRKIQAEFNFSRAKATRIIMRLEEKGLVKKQHRGRTNKLEWIKK